jgi:hypothetical protein
VLRRARTQQMSWRVFRNAQAPARGPTPANPNPPPNPNLNANPAPADANAIRDRDAPHAQLPQPPLEQQRQSAEIAAPGPTAPIIREASPPFTNQQAPPPNLHVHPDRARPAGVTAPPALLPSSPLAIDAQPSDDPLLQLQSQRSHSSAPLHQRPGPGDDSPAMLLQKGPLRDFFTAHTLRARLAASADRKLVYAELHRLFRHEIRDKYAVTALVRFLIPALKADPPATEVPQIALYSLALQVPTDSLLPKERTAFFAAIREYGRKIAHADKQALLDMRQVASAFPKDMRSPLSTCDMIDRGESLLYAAAVHTITSATMKSEAILCVAAPCAFLTVISL